MVKENYSIFDYDDLNDFKKQLDKKFNKYKDKMDPKTHKELKDMLDAITSDIEKLENYNSYMSNVVSNQEDGFDPEEDPIDFLFESILDNMELDFEDYIINNCEDLSKTEAFHIFSVIRNHLEIVYILFSYYMSIDFKSTMKNNRINGIDENINNFEMKEYNNFEIFIPKDVRKTNSVALYLYRNGNKNIDDAISFHFAFDNIFNPLYLTQNNPLTYLKLEHKNAFVEGYLRDIVRDYYSLS